MQYNSLREYFYKLHNLLYVIALVPLFVFLVLYWQMGLGNIEGVLKTDERASQLVLIILSLIVVTDWTVSLFLFNKGMKAIRTLGSLGSKLDRYFSFTIIRFALIESGALGLAIGFYLTENSTFTIIFAASFCLMLLFWPTPSKVCDDLQLKGDERLLVISKKDRLH
ncbi:MAG TPA: hypothetical protein VGK39_08880 [Cyclobacteriaceae bacterium]